MNDNHYLTVDLGASSGRVIITTVGDSIKQREVHRFNNQPMKAEVLLVWDFETLLKEVYIGIQKAFIIEPNIQSIGIDTWGCDYGYIGKDGKLLRNPVCYRDERTYHSEALTKYHFTKEQLYAETGIQHLRFNTIYQVAYDLKHETNLMSQVDTFLMIPDLIAYHLTGEKRCELTNLSTTSFYNPIQGKISNHLYALGFKSEWIPKPIQPGETYGWIKDDLVDTYGFKKIPVIAVCTHDTASAIHSITVNPYDVYISSGTWSLIGKLLAQPLINLKTYQASYTNEVGYEHHIRFLKNISGFWVKNKIIEAFQLIHVDYAALDEQITLEPFEAVIDLDHPDFELGENILERIQCYCIKTNQAVPKTLIQYLKTFNFSLVSKYRHHLETLEALTQIKTKQIIIIGGGSANNLINQMTADMTGIPVIKGYKEASAIGNALVQHQVLHPNFNKVTLNQNEQVTFLPKNDLSSIYQMYQNILKETIV